MKPKSRKILNTIKTYRMSPNLAFKLNELSIRNKISEAQLVRDILMFHIEQSGL
jgi:predicted DNA-binding protein